jgi:hypothetical protein
LHFHRVEAVSENCLIAPSEHVHFPRFYEKIRLIPLFIYHAQRVQLSLEAAFQLRQASFAGHVLQPKNPFCHVGILNENRYQSLFDLFAYVRFY